MKAIQKLLQQFLIEDDPAKVKCFANQLYFALMNFTGFDRGTKVANQAIMTNGIAITATQATDCIKDGLRTKRFLEGTIKAIDKKLEQQALPLKILYAGCGGFAPFCTLTLLHRHYTPNQVQFHLVDINDYSIQTARYLIHKLKLENYIIALEKTDCTDILLKSEYDIFISETMDVALNHESMFYIWRNIIPQLSENTITIPNNVKIYLSSDAYQRQSATYSELLLDLNSIIWQSGKTSQYPSKSVQFPPISSVFLQTQIVIDDELVLEGKDTHITRPLHFLIHPYSSGNFLFRENIRKWEFVP